MQDVFCTRDPVNLRYPPQSLSTIIFDGILWIVSELNHLLSNRRQSQDKSQIPVVQKGKTYTFSILMGRDLSVTKVKARYINQTLRLETPRSIEKLISVFGLSSVAGVRKKLPLLSKQLRTGEGIVTTSGGVYLLDVVNFVDVEGNEIPARARFTYNASGQM
jgi:hypothetical protein